MNLPVKRTIAIMMACLTLVGCHPGTVSSGSVPSATANTAVNNFAPGVAEPKLAALVAAAGSDRLLQAKITHSDVSIAVLTPEGKAATWGFRNGAPAAIDGDLANVGQATFTLNDFDLSNLAEQCQTAAAVAGTAQNQEVQLVEYSGGQVYVTVTTQPESTTVFFRPDGTLVPVLDYAQPSRDVFASALDAIIVGDTEVSSVGFDPALGLYLEKATPDGAGQRIVRPSRFPTRFEARAAKPTTPAFDPRQVTPELLTTLATRYAKQGKFTLVIDRRENMREPLVHIQADGKTIVTDIAGNDVTHHLGGR